MYTHTKPFEVNVCFCDGNHMNKAFDISKTEHNLTFKYLASICNQNRKKKYSFGKPIHDFVKIIIKTGLHIHNMELFKFSQSGSSYVCIVYIYIKSFY